MKLSDISTVAPDGWHEITGTHVISRGKLVIDGNTRLIGSARLTVQGSARLTVQGSAWLTVQGSAWLTVQDSARLTVRDSAGLSVWGSARLTVQGSAWLSVQDSAGLSVRGWTEIARSKWALLRSPTGHYYAGCRVRLTLEQAINHWDRNDDRAIEYVAAILADLATENRP